MPSSEAMSEKEMARTMTAFLFNSPGYNRESVIMEMVKAQITLLARSIAAEIVEATPEVSDILRVRTAETLREVLAQDTWLKKIVIDSMAKGLHQAALRVQPEDMES